VSGADHKRFEEDIGAFLLGALANGDQEKFEHHLATCHVCQDELERLRGAADALPRSVEQYEPPASLKIALMEQVYAETAPEKAPRRTFVERLGLGRLTPQLVGAAAAVVLAVGVVGGWGISQLGGGDDPGGTRSVVASVDKTRVGDAQATLHLRDGAGHLSVTAMPQPRAGQVYEIWLQRGDRVEPGPLFSVDRNGNGVGAVPGDLAGVDAVLVTRERAGGARQPTEAPVVRVKV
jgi:anti-sigma-K factor RskA